MGGKYEKPVWRICVSPGSSSSLWLWYILWSYKFSYLHLQTACIHPLEQLWQMPKQQRVVVLGSPPFTLFNVNVLCVFLSIFLISIDAFLALVTRVNLFLFLQKPSTACTFDHSIPTVLPEIAGTFSRTAWLLWYLCINWNKMLGQRFVEQCSFVTKSCIEALTLNNNPQGVFYTHISFFYLYNFSGALQKEVPLKWGKSGSLWSTERNR